MFRTRRHLSKAVPIALKNVLSLPAKVVALVEAITPRYRATVLLAAWCGLRRGEVLGLRVGDVGPGGGHRDCSSESGRAAGNGRASFDAEPKTDAGKRTVVIPPHVIPVLAQHVIEWADPDRVFVGRDGQPMRGDAVR